MSKKKVIAIALLLILATIITIGVVDAVNMKRDASNIKAGLKTTVTAIKSGDAKATDKSLSKIKDANSDLEARLNSPLWKLASKIPVVGNDINSANKLSVVLNSAIDEIADPAVDTFKKYPLSKIKVNDGFNVNSINAYISLMDKVVPFLEKNENELKNIKFRFIDIGDAQKYFETLSNFSKNYDSLRNYVDLLKAFIGNGEDKLYMIAAQNSAEIRASGGFPGSIGTLKIKDGILSIGDFVRVYDVLSFNNPPSALATSEEMEYFSHEVVYPRDACYNPSFERVAYTMAEGYEAKMDEKIEGVISLAPQIIQEILKVLDEKITLSDGTVLDGTNATKVLQYDIYCKYFSRVDAAQGGNAKCDELFAETAKATMKLFTEKFSLDSFAKYIDIFKSGADNRIVLLWHRDDQTEQLIKKLNCSGSIASSDATGVYFSCSVASKLGWFFDIDTKINPPKTNADGTKTYTVNVTLRNVLTDEDIKNCGGYIIAGGVMVGNVHLVAPKDGTITDIKGISTRQGEYQGFEIHNALHIYVTRGNPLNFTYKVTTKSNDLEAWSTPTLQEYR